jgi:hypothetical protein
MLRRTAHVLRNPLPQHTLESRLPVPGHELAADIEDGWKAKEQG